MKLVCAWCNASIERSGYDQSLESETSHGMCPACSEAFASQDGVSLQSHIDSIPNPILVVDSNNGIVATNAKACEMLGRKSDAMINELFGPVFNCAHARLPEGCGRTIHCSGCAIRKSVVATFNTGEPQISVPATLTVESPDLPSEVVLTITTVKSNGLVVMRLEQVKRAAL
jgi:nitrogen-specific signal transduction histidine kinase